MANDRKGPSVWDTALVLGTFGIIVGIAFYTFYTMFWR